MTAIVANINMPFWNADSFLDLVFRFGLHFIFLFIIAYGLYYRTNKRRDFLFTYLLISTMVFTLTFLLENVKLEIGMALGLFAVFGIIRYRTDQIPIKEMTYLFVLIGIAIVNSLANEKISIVELFFANMIIVFIMWVLEKVWRIKHISRKIVQYDRIDLVKKSRYQELINDLSERLELDITRVDVGKVDFLRDTARIIVYYDAQTRQYNAADDLEQAYIDND